MPETEIRIALPMSLEVVSALTLAVGEMWPDAVIRTDSRDYVMVVPSRRPKRPTKRRMREILAETSVPDDAPEVSLTRVTTDGVKVGLDSRDEAWQQLAAWAYTCLNFHEAVNYVEQPVSVELPSGERATLVITAAWSKGQTPHELRMKAERERDEALARLKTEEDQ